MGSIKLVYLVNAYIAFSSGPTIKVQEI